jgi:hypothetical protein
LQYRATESHNGRLSVKNLTKFLPNAGRNSEHLCATHGKDEQKVKAFIYCAKARQSKPKHDPAKPSKVVSNRLLTGGL